MLESQGASCHASSIWSDCGRFANYDAVAAPGPIGRDSVHLKASRRELFDEHLLWNAVPAAVLGYAFHRRDEANQLARWEINNGKPADRLQRSEGAGIDFCGMREMMINVAHEDGITTLGWKIGV